MKTFCKTCNKEFQIKPYLFKESGNVCSRECRKTGKKIICEICGKEFYKKKCLTQKKYCSLKCSHKKTLFKKGSDPWNKDLKGIHLSPSSEFKKGCESFNKSEIGEIKIRVRTRDKKPRAFIKIDNPNKWIEYAQFVWIKHHGNIPKGFVIHHIDRNTLNDSIENLSCLSRKDHIEEHRQDLSGV